ncbi:class I SAM-dependent methyltransferase [Pseudonocardia acaciae]|uniref:class I SAM-dependent methyltransferase n=1 Tax=Pseudonocardia acaciae TaxID=551276 RepID=UPI00049056F6|nr:class I SAM-dependent methyltransferase [Pseudonocardia acaciae]
MQTWNWDPSLYAGSAPFYTQGRVPYPSALTTTITTALNLNGTGRLLDIGCGPGSLTLPLAPMFADVIGLDPDADMLHAAAAEATRQGIDNVQWRQLRAEDLPADLPPPTVISFAQSFHWTDRPRVAATARRMLPETGAVVHVHATTHQGIDTTEPLPHPQPPRAAITALIHRYLGTIRRAGQRTLPNGTASGEEEIYRAAGFRDPQRIELPARIVERTPEQVRASVYSLSSSAPHLFGTRLDAFDAQLRELLHQAAPAGLFSERLREIAVEIWQ